MKIKEIPKDFIVEEIFDINSVKSKEKEDETYRYFILTKNNYSQMKAILKIAKVFGVSKKRVHFAGTKDKVGITKQMICISKVNEKTFQNNIDYFNGFEDLNLEYVGEFNSRINLGDNLGNKFIIIVRDLDRKDIEKATYRIQLVNAWGLLNYFDEQRFGAHNNTHIIGKYVLQNKIDLAVKEILKSYTRDDDKEKLRIKGYLKKYKNDYAGAFRTVLHKKLRTLYINAYQSYIFNKILDEIRDEKIKTSQKEIELVNSNFNESDDIKEFVNKKLKEDNLSLESFHLKHMPELAHDLVVKRSIMSYPKNIKLGKKEKDELNKEKLKIQISFELNKGEYATNFIKQIFL